MALSTCPKCNGNLWELQEVSPIGSQFKLCFVQCSGCGAPVGTLEFRNSGDMLERQNVAIKEIAQHLGVHINL